MHNLLNKNTLVLTLHTKNVSFFTHSNFNAFGCSVSVFFSIRPIFFLWSWMKFHAFAILATIYHISESISLFLYSSNQNWLWLENAEGMQKKSSQTNESDWSLKSTIYIKFYAQFFHLFCYSLYIVRYDISAIVLGKNCVQYNYAILMNLSQCTNSNTVVRLWHGENG